MKNGEGRREASKREWLKCGFGAMGVGLSASLLNMLLFHGYPILTAEVAIVWAVCLLFAAVFAWVLADVRFSFKVAMGGILALLLADWNMASYTWPLVAGAAGLIFSWRMGIDFFRLVTVAFAVIGVTSLLGLGQRAERIETDKTEVTPTAVEEAPPLLVHLIVDEFEGVRGMNALPGQEGAGDAMADALVGHGFTVYDDAHTQYYRSVSAIPAALNYGALGTATGDSNFGGQTGPTRWFADLAARGYEVEVVQSSFVDLCSGNAVTRCRTYWRENLNGLREEALSTTDRARLIGVHIGRQLVLALAYSGVIENALGGNFLRGDVDLHAPLKHRGEANTINSIHELERIEKVVAGKGAGDAVVAHVLTPHFPYSHDEQCKVRPYDEWQMPWQETPLKARAAAYVRQVDCVTRLVTRIADAADEASGGDYVMIVHGDHGSRLGRELPRWGLDQGDQRLWLHAASTLFAVKTQTAMPGRMRGPASLGELLGAMEGGGARVPPEPAGNPPQLLEPPPPVDVDLPPIDLDWAN